MELLFVLSPFLVLGLGAMLLMLAEVFSNSARGLALVSAVLLIITAAFAGAVACTGLGFGDALDLVRPWLIMDRFALFLMVVICLGAALSSLLAGGYLVEHGLERGEFYCLLLFATFGAMMVVASGDSLTLFLGLETMSLGAYALTAFRRGSPRSMEGALKYFLLGSFAAALLLYGLVLLYGETGHTDLAGMGQAIAAGGGKNAGVAVAMVLILVGLLFKVSAVPFHMWTPDAYEGAATPATTYMAVVVKASAFGMMLRVLGMMFGDVRSASWGTGWPPILAVIAILTMTVANLIAGRQDSVKRMLAYSSIAHAGYLLVGVVATLRSPEQAGASVLFYLLTYTVSTAGAFGALILCGSHRAEAVSYDDLAGLGKRHPAIAFMFSFFLISLTGIPPTAGFFGKWYIFQVAMGGGFYLLTILAFINSVIAAYYYLRVLVMMYMREPVEGAPIAVPMRSGYVYTALVVSAIFVLFFGLMPSQLLDFALAATAKLSG